MANPLSSECPCFPQVTLNTVGSIRHGDFESLLLLLPFVERAGFGIGRSNWPVVVEEEQDTNREE